MKKYLNVKATLICLGLAALVAVISVAALMMKPNNENNNDDYTKKTTLFSMGEKCMTLDEAFFVTKNRQAYYEEYYHTYGTSFSWDIPVEAGKTYEDIILDECFLFTKQIFILSEYAKDNGITLTESEVKTIEAKVSSFMSESDSKMLNGTKATDELVSRVYTRTALYDKVVEQILEGKDLTIDNEEARQCYVAITEINPEYFDSPERIAEKIAERVNSGEGIGTVSSIYDTSIEKIYVGKNSSIKKEMIDFCLSLKDDECKITSIDGVYFVVYCYMENDETETKNVKEVLLEEKKVSYINEFVSNLEKENPVTVNTEAWNTINFDKPIYTKEDIIQSK